LQTNLLHAISSRLPAGTPGRTKRITTCVSAHGTELAIAVKVAFRFVPKLRC